jgi:hypothetical protein
MKRVVLRLSVLAVLIGCIPAFAVDGVVLINQATVASAGGLPFQITQPGSYRLSGDLTVPDGNTTAIKITADHVTVD